VKEGQLVVNKKKMECFLFTDSLLCCTAKSKGKLKYKQLVTFATTLINTDVVHDGEKYHFELISPSGKFYINSSNSEKDMWKKFIEDGIEKAQKDLLGSVFVNGSGTGKEFKHLQEESWMRKRSETALHICENERVFVEKLKIAVTKFIEPLKETAQTYPVLTREQIGDVFCNLDKLYTIHSEFLKKLENKVTTWDATSTIGDVFFQQLTESAPHYRKYGLNYPKAVWSMDEFMKKNVHWTTFLVQKESEHKVSLPDLLEQPIRRMSYYYLQLEEMAQYTGPSHVDHEDLKASITRLKEYTEYQKSEGKRNSLNFGSLSRRSIPVDSIFYDTKSNSVRFSTLSSGSQSKSKRSSVRDLSFSSKK